MSFRVYKCNAKDLPHQVAVGDWDYVFERKSTDWGSTGLKNVDKVSAGDVLFAYQTDRSELVGIVEVLSVNAPEAANRLVVRPLEELRISMPRLKKLDGRIKNLKACKSGVIATVYSISTWEALHLLDVARSVSLLDELTEEA